MENPNNDSSLSTEITKDFLLSVLGNGNKDSIEIVSFNVTRGSKPGDNYMSVLYAIEVKVKEGNEVSEDCSNTKTLHLLFKCLPSHRSRQEVNAKTNFFYRELKVYQTFIPELMRFQKEDLKLTKSFELSFTHAVAGKALDMTSKEAIQQMNGEKMSSLENFLLMEDLRKSYGFVMPDRRDPLTIHQMRLAIPALARFHALSWVYKVVKVEDLRVTNGETSLLEKFPFFRILNEDGMQDWIDLIGTNLKEELKVIEDKYGVGHGITTGIRRLQSYVQPLCGLFNGKIDEKLCYELMRDKKSRQAPSEFPAPWTTILHGDCWSGNLLYRYEGPAGSESPVEVKIIDLQMTMEGCLTVDLLGLIYWSTNTELRKRHLEEILALYTKTFEEVCLSCNDCRVPPGFNLENLKERFHRGKIVGIIIGLGLYPLLLKDDEATVDLEGLDESKDFNEMLETTGGGHEIMSPLVVQRVLEVVEEMYEEGVI